MQGTSLIQIRALSELFEVTRIDTITMHLTKLGPLERQWSNVLETANGPFILAEESKRTALDHFR